MPRSLLQTGLAVALLIAGAATPTRAASCTYMVYCDSRGAVPWEDINAQIVTEFAAETVAINPDFVLIPGDLVYSGTLNSFQVWLAAMKPVYDAGIAVYPVIGNHDANDPIDFIDLFGPTLPDNGPAGQIDRTFFVRHKNVLAIGLDEFVGPGFYNQQWLDDVLRTNTAPHVVAFGHMPGFKVAHYDCLDNVPAERDYLWKALAKAGARAYFTGHDHFYDHMRVDDGDGNEDNDIHQFVVGSAGAPLYDDSAYDGQNTVWTPTRVYHDKNFGYLVVRIEDLKATFTWYHRTEEGAYEPGGDSWAYTAHPQPELMLQPAQANLRLSFMARDGMTNVIEESLDLQSWNPVFTNTTAGQITFDVNTSATSSRMFRVRQP